MSPRVKATLLSLAKTLAIHFGIAAAATWPIVASPLSRMIGHADGDVWNHAWGPWWFWQSLGTGQLPWHTEWLNAPWGGVLWFIDPIGGVIGASMVGFLGLEGTYNAIIVLYVAAASFAASGLARRLGATTPGAYVASAAVAFGPYLLSEVHNGISEAANLAPGILALWACARALDEGRWRDWALVGLALGLSALGSAYYALATGLVVAVWCALRLAVRPRALHRQLPKAALGAALAGALSWPIADVMRESVYADGALIHRAETQAELLILHNAVDPRTFLWPLGFQSVDLESWGESFLHSGYLGWSVVVMAAIGAWRTRRFGLLAAALVALSVSLGPHLFYDGAWVTNDANQRYALPYRLMQTVLPPQAITHSLRLAMPGIVGLSALAAAALAGVDRRWAVGAAAAVGLEMVTLGGAPWPVARTPEIDTSAQEWIAEQPAEVVEGRPIATVLDLPGAVGNTMTTSRYLSLQATHRRPIPYRPDARGSTSAMVNARIFQALALASEVRPGHRSMLLDKLEGVKTLKRGELRKLGVQYVVVHRALERGGEHIAWTEDLLTRLYGEPRVFGEMAVFETGGEGRIELTEADRGVWQREGGEPGPQP